MSDIEQLRDHCRFMAAHTTPGVALRPSYTQTLRTPVWSYPVPTDAERVLWQQLADEIDGYLTSTDDGQDSLL